MCPDSPDNTLRFDLQVIAAWIEPGATVLDLGCGSGDLLAHLQETKQVIGCGIDSQEDKVAACISRGLSVLQGDINQEVADYPDASFDYVILSQTLQQVYEPATLISSLLRIGRKVVVSFPNFSHWRSRLQLLLGGRAPRTRQLPYEWYDTPNIRVITLKDFQRFARKFGFRILKEVATNTHSQDLRGSRVRWLPNLRATYGVILIESRQSRYIDPSFSQHNSKIY